MEQSFARIGQAICQLPILIRFELVLGVAVLMGATSVFWFQHSPWEYLYFFFPLLWLLWGLSAFLHPKQPLFLHVFAWLIIDCAALILFCAVEHAIPGAMRANGAEFAWVVAYFPIIFPVAIVIWLANDALIGLNIPLTFVSEWRHLSPYLDIAIDWASVSLVAISLSFVILFLARYINVKRSP